MRTRPTNTAGLRKRLIKRGFSAADTDVVPGDVVAALEKLGIDVLRVTDAGEAVARCPAHLERVGREDRHPSFSVNIHTGLFGCWSCEFKGGFTSLVAYMRKTDRSKAAAWVRSQGTIRAVNRLLAKTKDEEPEQQQITEADLALYVAPPPAALRERKLTAEACQHYGVLWDDRNDWWILPIRDADGTLLGWQEKGDRYFRNYPPTVKKSKCLFGLHTVPERSERVVVVESPLDAVLVHAVTGEHVVSSYGAHVSDTQMQLLADRTSTAVFFLDNDMGGRRGLMDVISRWRGRGIGLATVRYDLLEDADGCDPGELEDAEILLLLGRVIPVSILPLALSA